MKRLVIVADNPLIVGAIRTGLRDSGALDLLGYVDARKTSAARITQAGAEVVLVDEGDDSEPAIALIQNLREQDEDIKMIVLALRMEGEWLERAFAAGANGAMSKAIHPAALATLIRETVAGHIVHSPARLRVQSRVPRVQSRVPRAVAAEHSTLTERETEILRFVASGATNAEIARKLWITQQTVKFHVSNVYRKLDVGNRTEACHYAHVNGLVAPGEPLVPASANPSALAIAS
jgi:DNA-binding NarL/FixJ family response regulator